MTRIENITTEISADSDQFFSRFYCDMALIFPALIAGEDRRAASHNGVDWLSLLRAVLYFPWTRSFRGISTIEQQLVRTLVKRRGSLVLCKLREMSDARHLSLHASKEQIWASYLWRAYFGANMSGYTAARAHFVHGLRPLSAYAAASIVSCLKYPRPKSPTAAWHRRHRSRVRYILQRLAVKSDFNPSSEHLEPQARPLRID
jgi:membrane carboxypeptidase/penicillin-binding protein PbpC